MNDTFRVIFRPARNGSGVMCRLPDGKVAFPSRYFWDQEPPGEGETWLVRLAGQGASVGYVRPVRRIAVPRRDT